MSTSYPTMISGWELEQQAAARRKPFEFITHQQFAVGQVRFSSGFTKLSASGPVDRYLACGDDAELVLTTPGMPVAPHTRATEADYDSRGIRQHRTRGTLRRDRRQALRLLYGQR